MLLMVLHTHTSGFQLRRMTSAGHVGAAVLVHVARRSRSRTDAVIGN